LINLLGWREQKVLLRKLLFVVAMKIHSRIDRLMLLMVASKKHQKCQHTQLWFLLIVEAAIEHRVLRYVIDVTREVYFRSVN